MLSPRSEPADERWAMSSVDDRNEPSEWSDSRFRTLAEHASALVLELSQRGALVYVGPSVRDVLGYEPDELQRMGSLDLIHPDDRERTAANYSEVLSGERRAHSVHRARHKDGSWRWMQDVACSFTTERGELRVLVLARDVSDQKRLEQQLERQLAVQGQVADLSRVHAPTRAASTH